MSERILLAFPYRGESLPRYALPSLEPSTRTSTLNRSRQRGEVTARLRITRRLDASDRGLCAQSARHVKPKQGQARRATSGHWLHVAIWSILYGTVYVMWYIVYGIEYVVSGIWLLGVAPQIRTLGSFEQSAPTSRGLVIPVCACSQRRAI